MKDLPANIRVSINKYEPITVDGHTLYPICVKDYYDFLIGREAIEFMQQSLPVSYMSLPLLQAEYSLDFEAAISGKQPTGLFTKALVMLALSLRLEEQADIRERARAFEVIVDTNNAKKLKALRYTKNGEVKDITPISFQRMRPIIASQNGIILEKDNANPELVEAEREINSMNAPDLELGIENLMVSVATLSGIDESEIYDWAILKLNRRAEAYKRVLDYMTCAIGEMNGTKWRGGNPVPSPWFAKKITASSALVSMDRFANGAGKKAMSNPGVRVT